jgi:hypothetical protein
MKIDEWLPDYQVSASYSTTIRASVESTYASLAKADFANLPIFRVLMTLRGYRPGNTAPNSSATKPNRRFGSFLELAVVPEEEVVLGIAGRFWRPDGGIVRDLTIEEFLRFRREGYAKGVWNFHISLASEGTRLSTETRVQTFGRPAALKFRAYWLLIGPFSGLIRWAMLREVKRIAERTPV